MGLELTTSLQRTSYNLRQGQPINAAAGLVRPTIFGLSLRWERIRSVICVRGPLEMRSSR